MVGKTGVLPLDWLGLKQPAAQWSVMTVLAISIVSGIIFWGGFNTFMEATNTQEFCLSCHEMRDNVFSEFKKSIHYKNRAGVRATCPDCHVPRDWSYKLVRKLEASRELLAKLTGHVDTPAKFEEHRMEMATREWARMKASDSRECRNCHNFDAMQKSPENLPVYEKHMAGKELGKTCIDCHKGVAHLLPREYVFLGEENTP